MNRRTRVGRMAATTGRRPARNARRGGRTAARLLVALLVLMVLPILDMPAGAQSTSTGSTTKLADGTTTAFLNFTQAGTLSFDVRINKAWTINEAVFQIRGGEQVIDPGTEFETHAWPANLRLDVGGDSTIEFQFPGEWGRMANFGLEANEPSPDLRFIAKETQEVPLHVPVADVETSRFVANSTSEDQFEYKAVIPTSPERVVWRKSSIGFTLAQTVNIPDDANDLAVTNIDLNNAPDVIVASDKSGVVTLANRPPNGLQPGVTWTGVGQGERLLAMGVGDYDGTTSQDVVVGTDKGKVYVFNNQGQGILGVPEAITLGDQAVDAVLVTDLDGDGDGDIIAGYEGLSIFLIKYDLNQNTWEEPLRIPSGLGGFTDLVAADLDQDGLTDVVGANQDGAIYVFLNSGGNTLVPQPKVSAATKSMRKVVAADLTGDGIADVGGVSEDGRFYLFSGLGGGVLDSGDAYLVSQAPLRDLALADLNKDGKEDLLLLSQDRFLYVLVNRGFGIFGGLEAGVSTASRLLEAGASALSITTGDVDHDSDVDLLLGTTKDVQVWTNNLGPFEVTSADFAPALDTYLEQLGAEEQIKDPWGTPFVNVPLQLTSEFDSDISLLGLNITYNYTAPVDLRAALGVYKDSHKSDADTAGDIIVPVTLTSDGPGQVFLEGLHIAYSENFAVTVISPSTRQNHLTNQSLVFEGRSTIDREPDFANPDVNYTWRVEGRAFGWGRRVVVADIEEELGALEADVQTFTVRLTAKVLAGSYKGATDSSEFAVTVERPSLPVVRVKLSVSETSVVEGTKVRIIMQIENTGKINATGLTIQLRDDTVGRSIQAYVIPRLIHGEIPQQYTLDQTLGVGKHTIVAVIKSVSPVETEVISNDARQVTVTAKPIDWDFILTLAVFFALIAYVALLGLRIKKRRDDLAMRQDRKEEMKAMHLKIQAEMAQFIATTGGIGTAAQQAQLSEVRKAREQAEFERQNLINDIRAQVRLAEETLRQVREMGIDVDDADDLLASAKEALARENFDQALADAETAEDIATEQKERYEAAFTVMAQQAETEDATERRRKRLDRRRDLRKRQESYQKAVDGAEGSGQPPGDTPEGADGASAGPSPKP